MNYQQTLRNIIYSLSGIVTNQFKYCKAQQPYHHCFWPNQDHNPHSMLLASHHHCIHERKFDTQSLRPSSARSAPSQSPWQLWQVYGLISESLCQDSVENNKKIQCKEQICFHNQEWHQRRRIVFVHQVTGQQILQTLMEFQLKAIDRQQTAIIVDMLTIIRVLHIINYKQHYWNSEKGERRRNQKAHLKPKPKQTGKDSHFTTWREPMVFDQIFPPSCARNRMDRADNPGTGKQGRSMRQNLLSGLKTTIPQGPSSTYMGPLRKGR